MTPFLMSGGLSWREHALRTTAEKKVAKTQTEEAPKATTDPALSAAK